MRETGAAQLELTDCESERDLDPAERSIGAFDLILFALCCLCFLIYLIESESVRYLLSHLGLRL